MSQGHTVSVVLDPEFGERLERLAGGGPVWIIDSPANTPVAHRLWKQPDLDRRFGGITTFKGPAGSLEDMFLSELGTIDLHHGEYSASPPYSVIQVLGCGASGDICAALEEIGFKVESTSQSGFTAVRKHGD